MWLLGIDGRKRKHEKKQKMENIFNGTDPVDGIIHGSAIGVCSAGYNDRRNVGS